MSNNMHKLRWVTLVNWYHFNEVDIPIKGDSIFFRGINGAGKSSLQDAIQTVITGADEVLTVLNAASNNDSKKSSRTIKDYVLGLNDAAEGYDNYHPRKESNSYIALNIEDNLGKVYTLGVALFAREGDHKVIKNYFCLSNPHGKNTFKGLTKNDFLAAKDIVFNWAGFQQKIISMDAIYTPAGSAGDFRNNCWDLASRDGNADSKIQEKPVVRAIKNALKFKEETDISEFTRTQILPELNINTLRIQNDYESYERIAQEIALAEETLEALKRINAAFNVLIREEKRAAHYRWIEYEARFNGIDEEIARNEDRLGELDEQLSQNQADLEKIQDSVKLLEKAYEDAVGNYASSSFAQAKAELERDITLLNEKLADSKRAIENLTTYIRVLTGLQLPEDEHGRLAREFNQLNETFRQTTIDKPSDLINSWPASVKDLSSVQTYIDQAKKLDHQLAEECESAKKNFKDIDDRLTELRNISDGLQSGVKLLKQTENLVGLLAAANIKAVPVCELSDINDEEWQDVIEAFLGRNRETLIIIDHEELNEDSAYEKCMAIIRSNKRGRGLNVDGGKVAKPVCRKYADKASPGTADALIVSDNPVAKGYLISLLSNMKLVNTEAELRKEKRAMTKDLMVATGHAGGIIRPVEFKLFGAETRQREAKRFHDEFQALLPQRASNKTKMDRVDDIYRTFNKTLERLSEILPEVSSSIASMEMAHRDIELANEKIRRLDASGDQALKEDLDSAKQAVDAARQKERDSASARARLEYEKQQIDGALPTLRAQADEYAGLRADAASVTEYFDFEEANKLLADLEEIKEGDYADIASTANKRHEEALKRVSDRSGEAQRALQEYNTRYQPDNRAELASMSPREVLKSCEKTAAHIEESDIVIYRQDAEDAKADMLNSFRAEVANKLKDCFAGLKTTFRNLNHSLADLKFNENTYKFKFQVVEQASMKAVHKYIESLDGPEVPNDLLDTRKDDEAIAIIERMITTDSLDEISDYRNFFSYELIQKNHTTGIETKYSKVQEKGSGGQKNAPLYVVLGASLMSAFKIKMVGGQPFGGLAIALFDEAFMRTDANNTKSILKFLKSVGIQVIISGPPETSMKMGHIVEDEINIIRSGGALHLDPRNYKEKAITLLNSDDPSFHPELVDAYESELEKEAANDV